MQHTWKWVSARLSPKRIWSQPNHVPARQCMASIEHLGDRVMLSADAIGEIIIKEGPPTGDTAVLIALIKGELPLVKAELDLLKLAGSDFNNKIRGDLHKLTESFLKIDAILYKAGIDGIKFDGVKGESTDDKHKDAFQQLDEQFVKLDGAIKFLGGGETLEAKFIEFKDNTLNLLTLVQDSKVAEGAAGDLDSKTEETYIKVIDGFWKLDEAIVKVQEDLIARKAGKGQQEAYLHIKLSDVLISSIKQIDDGDIKGELLGLEADTDAILIGLLKLDDGGNGGGDIITIT